MSAIVQPPEARVMSGAEIVLRALKDQGVEVIFGYPGGAVLPLYDALFQQNAIRHILVRHEQAAVHAAEGYARSTGKVGVVLVTSGPGATNAVTGLVDALMDSIPIVCPDSMQVYRDLRVLTARPTPAEEALAPHRLYGVRPAAEPANAAWWREQALGAMDEASKAGKLPILCGGTGLYFLSLTRGLADVPAVPAWAREEARAQLAASGPAALHERLTRLDPATAAELRPTDGQRLARALEVVLGTGRGLAEWRSCGAGGAAAWRRWAVLLRPPREELRDAVAARFDGMLRDGALDEVRAMLDRGLDPALPAMRAHGVPELAAHLTGRLALSDARDKAVANTRQYVKRQDTWFRHHPLADAGLTRQFDARFAAGEQFSERVLAEILAFLQALR